MVTGTGMGPESGSGGHMVRNGIILDAVGAGLVIGSVVSFAAGTQKFNTEAQICPSSTCPNQADLTRAQALLYNGDGYRNAGAGMLIGGGVALLAGTYLIITGHHREASHVTLQATPRSAGLAFTSGF
jgi:hypothetical protein